MNVGAKARIYQKQQQSRFFDRSFSKSVLRKFFVIGKGAKPTCFIKSSKNSSEVSSSHIAWKRGIILRLGLY